MRHQGYFLRKALAAVLAVFTCFVMVAQAATTLELRIVPRPPAEPEIVCINEESAVTFEICLIDRKDNRKENFVVKVTDQEYVIDSGGGLITKVVGLDGFTQTPSPLPQSTVTFRKAGPAFVPTSVTIFVKYSTAGVKTVTIKGRAKVGADLLVSNEGKIQVQVENPDVAITFVDLRNREIELGTSFSHPRPVVKVGLGQDLADITLNDLKINAARATASVHIHGQVTCDIADTIADRSGDVKQVFVEIKQVHTTSQYQQVPIKVVNVSKVPATAFRPVETPADIVHPFVGRFEADVEIPLTTGSNLVSVKAVNAIGLAGYDSFSIRVDSADFDFDENGKVLIRGISRAQIRDVVNHPSSDPGIFNPIWVFVTDKCLTKDNIRDAKATFFGQQFPLIMQEDGRVRIDRPFIEVGQDLAKTVNAPNIINAVARPEATKATYKTASKELSWSYTSQNHQNYYRYAAGTTVKHPYFDDLLLQGWSIDRVEIVEETGFFGIAERVDTQSKLLKHDPLPAMKGKGGRAFTIEIGTRAVINPRKSLNLVVTKKGEKAKELKNVARFEVVPLKTIIVGVDGLAFASAKSVIAGKNPTKFFNMVFNNSVEHTKPALSAFPTVTFANWPGVFSGENPARHGWTGNAFFPREFVPGGQREGNLRYPFGSANSEVLGRVPPTAGIDNRQNIGIALGPHRPGFLVDSFDMILRALPDAGSLYDELAASTAANPRRRLVCVSDRQFYSKSTSQSVEIHDTHFEVNDPRGHDPVAARRLDVESGDEGLHRWNTFRNRLDVLTLYFPGPDNLAHAQGGTIGDVTNPSPAIEEQLRRVTDEQLGRIIQQIIDDGYLNACLFALVADHGLHAFRNVDQFNITSAVTRNNVETLRLQALFDTAVPKGLNMPLWRNVGRGPDNFHAEINSFRSVYSPSGGMAQIYLRGPDADLRTWQEPPRRRDIFDAGSLLFREAVGYAGQLYPDLAPRKAAPASNGAFGNPPAIFVRVSDGKEDQPKNNHFLQDFRWVKGVEKAPQFEPMLDSVDAFLAARKAADKTFDWPEFKARLAELNHKNAAGSRTGDIIVVSDGVAGYLCINQVDGLSGWHGGATISESHVPLMFNMPGPVLVRPNGKTNPQFVHDGFDSAVETLMKRNLLAKDGQLRNWHLSRFIVDIVGKVRSPRVP